MRTNIEINSIVSLDGLRDALQDSLSTEDLAKFAIGLGEKLTEDGEFYRILSKKAGWLWQQYNN